MEKKQSNRRFSPETLAKEWRQAVVFLEKMQMMAGINQGTVSLTPDQHEVYNTVIRHAQEATTHLQMMFDALGRLRLANPTILH